MNDLYHAKLYNYFKYELHDAYDVYNKLEDCSSMIIWKRDTLKKGIPYYIKNLTLNFHVIDNDLLIIPDTITKLTLISTDLLRNLFIPISVKTLTIQFITSMTYPIPKHITNLTLEYIEVPFESTFLPNGLLKLIIKKGICYGLTENILPNSLQIIVFGISYWGVLPYLPNLKLLFGCETNYPYDLSYRLQNMSNTSILYDGNNIKRIKREWNHLPIIQIIGNPNENTLYVYINGECIIIKCIKYDSTYGYFSNYIDLLNSIEYHVKKIPIGKIIFEDLIKNILNPTRLIKLSLLHTSQDEFYEAIERYLFHG